MIFLMIISAILLSMPMKLLFTLSVISHLICGNNNIWPLNLNLTYKTLWSGVVSALFISILKNLNMFNLNGLITLVLLR